MKRFLYWTPRVLAMLFAAFISLFALDVFEPGAPFLHAVPALLVHLLPVYLILAALIIAWRWERLGALLFAGMALLYVAVFLGKFDWRAYAAIAGPPTLIGALFLADDFYRRSCQAA